jgi:hypothetical protein
VYLDTTHQPALLVHSFRRFCYSNLTRTRPICVSDEHYLPTLLASYGLDNQTDCAGLAHFADWSAGGWHPRTFGAADPLDAALVERMRAPGRVGAGGGGGGAAGGPGGCDADAALESARALLLRQPAAEELAAQQGGAGRRGQVVLRRPPPPAGLLQRLLGQLLQLAWLPPARALVLRRQTSGALSRLPSDAGSGARQAAQQATGSTNPSSSQPPPPPPQQQPAAELQTSSYSQQLAAWAQQELGYRAMGPRCSLFARKFTVGALPGTLQMALSCGGLGFGGWCEHNQPSLEEQ